VQPDPEATGESLAALASAIADVRGQVLLVAEALASLTPKGPPVPRWIGIGQETYDKQLAALKNWIDVVLRPEYGGYDLRDCWANHHHVIWELSTLATEWHRAYGGRKPDLARTLDFYDRWLPNTMRRVNEYTRKCVAECDEIAQRRY
jgi:hypothetical protein